MLIFGCCVGPSGKFEKFAQPALTRVMEDDDLLVLEDGRDGICAAYNRILEIAEKSPHCEGVVLLHDDTELVDGSRRAIDECLHHDDVGVVGVIGGKGLYGASWHQSRQCNVS